MNSGANIDVYVGSSWHKIYVYYNVMLLFVTFYLEALLFSVFINYYCIYSYRYPQSLVYISLSIP